MSKNLPLIGLTAQWDHAGKYYRMLPGYVECIRSAGGLPVILPMCSESEKIDRMAEICDGILFTGGPDIDPSLYGSVDETGTVDVCPARDTFELSLMHAACERDLPVFCICRGIQILNVALGGTIYEDLPQQNPSNVVHRQRPPFSKPAHSVSLTPGSSLRCLLRRDTIEVNSNHHQAIRRLAGTLTVTASAADGVIEAVELPSASFCWGVQWHPELLAPDDAYAAALFENFIAACSRE